jgi:hypothetical protein
LPLPQALFFFCLNSIFNKEIVMQKRITLMGLSLVAAICLICPEPIFSEGELKAHVQSNRMAHSEVQVIEVQEKSAGSTLKEHLDMNDSQISQLQQEHSIFEQKIQPLHEQLRQLEEQSQASERVGDANALGQSILARIPIQKQMESEFAARRERILALLTADQKTKVSQMMESLRSANEAREVLGALGLSREGREMIPHSTERGQVFIRHEK